MKGKELADRARKERLTAKADKLTQDIKDAFRNMDDAKQTLRKREERVEELMEKDVEDIEDVQKANPAYTWVFSK